MANTKFRDSDGSIVYRKSSGAGTDLDPRISEFLESNSAALLAAAQAIQAAVEILDNIVAGSEAQVDVLTMPTVTVQDGSGSLTVDGPLTDTQLRATAVPVADGGGSLTVDGTVAISGTVAVTDNGSTLSVDDGAGSLTVDGDVTITSPDVVITVTPTLDTNAYASGDLLFDATEVATAVRTNGGAAILQSVTVIDKADQKVAFTLGFANAATDFGTLNSAPDPDDTEAATVIGWVPVAASDYIDLGGASVACMRNLGLLLKAGASATSLYIFGVNGTGTPTYAASDLVFQLGFLRS